MKTPQIMQLRKFVNLLLEEFPAGASVRTQCQHTLQERMFAVVRNQNNTVSRDVDAAALERNTGTYFVRCF